MFLRILLQQYHSVCADSFLASCEAELLGGGGFDGDIIDVDAHDIGKGLLHLGNVRVELGTLSADGGIDVAYGVAFGCYDVDGFAKQYLGVDVLALHLYMVGLEHVARGVSHSVGCLTVIGHYEQPLGVHIKATYGIDSRAAIADKLGNGFSSAFILHGGNKATGFM